MINLIAHQQLLITQLFTCVIDPFYVHYPEWQIYYIIEQYVLDSSPILFFKQQNIFT